MADALEAAVGGSGLLIEVAESSEDQRLVDDWMATAAQRPLSVSHRRRCRTLIRSFARETGPALLETQTADVEVWLASRPLADGTRRIYLSILDRFFEWARTFGLRPDNPVTPMLCQRRHLERSSQAVRGQMLDGSAVPSLSELGEVYVQERIDRGDITSATGRNDRSAIDGLAGVVGDRPASHLAPEHWAAWVATRTHLSPGARRSQASSVAGFCAWLMGEGIIASSPIPAPPVVVSAKRTMLAAVPPDRTPSPRCICGATAAELRRAGRQGPPLCPTCYQRARRSRQGAASSPNGDGLHGALVGAGLSPRTIRAYVNLIRSADRWFAGQGWQLATATGERVAAYACTLPNTWATRKGLRSALKHYWEHTQHPRPPLAAIRVPPKPSMVCLALEEDEAPALANAARSRDDLKGLAVVLGLYQALRREEIATLTWDAFAEEGWMTVQGKNDKRRTIPVHPVVTEYLAKIRPSAPYVFPGKSGSAVNPATIWAWIRDVAEESGVIGVRPHRLRHTALATLNDVTGDLRTVQAFAGHSNPLATAGYTRATRKRLQAAVAALDY